MLLQFPAFKKRSIFGKISIGKLENTFHPSPFGHILRSTYLELPERFPDFDFLHFVVMPNHIHLLLLRHSNDQSIPFQVSLVRINH